MFQRNATTSNSEVDGTTVNSAHEDAVLVDNDQGVDEVVNTDNNEKVCKIMIFTQLNIFI